MSRESKKKVHRTGPEKEGNEDEAAKERELKETKRPILGEARGVLYEA